MSRTWNRLTSRRWPLVLFALTAVLVAYLGARWKENSNRGGQKPAEPFRIAGNLYYVGANDVSSFLITGPEGHVLTDGGYPGTAPMIMESITRLGFDIRDVKVPRTSRRRARRIRSSTPRATAPTSTPRKHAFAGGSCSSGRDRAARFAPRAVVHWEARLIRAGTAVA